VTFEIGVLKDVLFISGIIAQAGITWWRVQEQANKLVKIDEDVAELLESREARIQQVSDIQRRLDQIERRVFNGGGKS
jgi:hypothetical protein